MFALRSPRNWILFLVLAVAAFVALVGLVTQADAQTTPIPEPAPKLAYSKLPGPAVSVGGVISFTITVTNSGNADSGSQTMVDTLPAGVDWQIATDSFGCSLGPSAIEGRRLLSCGPVIVEKRHINDAGDDFENGAASVTVRGVAFSCGPYFNVALFNGLNPVASTAQVLCPETPTPTPTQPPPTSTPTAPPAATATPTQVPPTATPTRFVPLPPSTGNTGPGTADAPASPNYAALLALMLIIPGLGIASTVWYVQRRE